VSIEIRRTTVTIEEMIDGDHWTIISSPGWIENHDSAAAALLAVRQRDAAMEGGGGFIILTTITWVPRTPIGRDAVLVLCNREVA